MPETLQEQLVKHLTDVHSIEEQALLQMRVAPRMARDPELARATASTSPRPRSKSAWFADG